MHVINCVYIYICVCVYIPHNYVYFINTPIYSIINLITNKLYILYVYIPHNYVYFINIPILCVINLITNKLINND